jgi:malate dehydrogenase (oxaloacetate-decarboxylating)
VEKKLDQIKIVINGAGAAATAVTKLLFDAGAQNIIINDKVGILNSQNKVQFDSLRQQVIAQTNRQDIAGGLAEAVAGADLFIGLSVADVLTKKMVETMAKQPLIFAMANPEPEIKPEIALQAGAEVIATGRSDYPNQINNVLAFPGVFRGALDVRARAISEKMKIAAARAIAELAASKLNSDYIIPDPFDQRVVPTVALAVARTAIKEGLARLELTDNELKAKIKANLL